VVGKLLKVEFFFQVETQQRAALFMCRLGAARQRVSQFQVRVRERGDL